MKQILFVGNLETMRISHRSFAGDDGLLVSPFCWWVFVNKSFPSGTG